jgi:hypothetical protein
MEGETAMTRSLLVFCPGHPLTLDALMPRAVLSAAAGGLLDGGHETHILDLGTFEALEGPGAVPLRALFAAPPAAACRGLGAARRSRALFRQGVETIESARVAMLLDTLKAHGPVDFIVYEAAGLADVRVLCQAAETVRRAHPRLPQFALGEAAHAWGPLLLDRCSAIDALIDADPEFCLPALAARIAAGRPWSDVPNLALRANGAIVHTAVEAGTALELLPAPCYSPEVYPALRAGKLRVWPVEDSRGGDFGGFGAARPALEQRQVRTRDAGAVCAAMDALARDHGARTFYFPGESTPAAHLDALSYALLARSVYVQYARRGHIRQTDPVTASTLYTSGCQAVDFRIDTGSQRLMHDFYGHPFCVTEVEQVLGACRRAGIFTAARFTYPCPEDDYHTQMETLRLVRRARPCAVSLTQAALLPGSAWHACAQEFGFRLRSGFRADPAPWESLIPAPPSMRTMGPAQVIAAAAGMRALLAEDGYDAPVSALEALVARVCGAHGAEAPFAARIREALATLDAATTRDMLGLFNAKATAPQNTIAFPRAVSVRAVVGN